MSEMSTMNNGMPIPTRSAPRPPGKFHIDRDRYNSVWSSNSFGPMTRAQKKKPPPRPPPPRFQEMNSKFDSKPRKPVRPTELFTNLFGIRTQKSHQSQQINVAYSGNGSGAPKIHSQSNNPLDGNVSLIDLSPPGSPTFTTRSSSDGVSVDSFGSDGTSNPSAFTSSCGSTSQTESAFEDDFDFFSILGKRTTLNDPWKSGDHGWAPDPFESVQSRAHMDWEKGEHMEKQVGDARFFMYNTGLKASKVPQMPTIIRARPPKPPAPKISPTNLAPKVGSFILANSGWSTTSNQVSGMANQGDYSPPMPSVPPPAPPTEYLTQSEFPLWDKYQPHGIALYDFPASHPDELPLKQGDEVILKKCINDEWLEGQFGNNKGIFPTKFIDIIVPLPGISLNIVNALYSFTGETWEDLTFEEGARIIVLSRISNDWLYGEFRGMKGQFPASYVDRVPQNLPMFPSNRL